MRGKVEGFSNLNLNLFHIDELLFCENEKYFLVVVVENSHH